MVLIYGAYGYTGRQLIQLLSKGKVDYYVAGRNEKKLMDLYNKIEGKKPKNYFICSTKDIFSVDAKDIDLVVNTAGPFSDIGENIVRFSYEIGANYIDCSGEAFWTKKLVEDFSKKFSSKNIFLSSGVAWETVAGEMAVKKLVRESGVEKVRKDNNSIYLVYLAEFNMSPGTLQSSVNIVRSGALVWNRGFLKPVKPLERRFEFDFEGKKFIATNITTSDIINVPNSLGELRDQIDFDVLFATRRAYLLFFLKSFLFLTKYRIFSEFFKLVFDLIPEPNEDDHPLASAIAFLVDSNGNVIQSASIKSSKPYNTTAKIMNYFVERFYEGKIKSSGYKSPTELVDFPENIFY